MCRKLGLIIVLFTVFLFIGTVLAEVSVGVKTGDWIEYSVNYTGTPTEGHDVTWARMEIEDVQGKSVNVAIMVEYSNGTRETISVTLNLEIGQLGDDFIIPADLNSGDTFFDKNVGNITIMSVEEKTYAGAKRTIVHAATSETSYYWDKATGILVEGNSNFPDYTMNTEVDRTNIWQPQLFCLDLPILYAAVISAVFLITAVLSIIVLKRKK